MLDKFTLDFSDVTIGLTALLVFLKIAIFFSIINASTKKRYLIYFPEKNIHRSSNTKRMNLKKAENLLTFLIVILLAFFLIDKSMRLY